jgi:hypothetical protein
MTIDPSDHVTAAETVHSRQFDDELLLLNLGTGHYFSLNPTGTRMYCALVSGKTPAEVATQLAPDYGLEVDALLRDCIALADDLLKHGLLETRK